MTVAITKEPSVTYKIRDLPEGGWADITLREWDGGGSFQCISDFGEFAHIWRSIGALNLRQFLLSLDKQYFMKKTRHDWMIFSAEKSVDAIREEIIRSRKDSIILASDARIAWDQLSDAEDAQSIDAFAHSIMQGYSGEDSVVDLIYGGDIYGVPFLDEYNPMCDLFWDRVWPRITEYWKEELND